MNITVKNEGNILHLRVVGISNVIEYPDVYDFTYSEGTLTRTGYLLEAITPQDRDAAIAVAMQDKDFRKLQAQPGFPLCGAYCLIPRRNTMLLKP